MERKEVTLNSNQSCPEIQTGFYSIFTMTITQLDPPATAEGIEDNYYSKKLLNLSKRKSQSYEFGGQEVVLNSRYKPHKVIGCGAYGLVISATDELTKQRVAIKKISNVFEDLIDGKRILREVRLLRHFNHPNIISLHDILIPPAMDSFEDFYFVTELMDTDLHRLISSDQPLSEDHSRYFIFQILCALKHIHASGVIHRDIKPQNILVNADCDVKLCDFGLARGNEDKMTEYVVTRWYRAPEILLACPSYGPAVDVWSVGCIFAEILLRAPLFPGGDFMETTNMICQCLQPNAASLDFVTVSKARRFLEKIKYDTSGNRTLAGIFDDETVDSAGFDLLSKLLAFNPAHRISVDEAMNHPYFDSIREDDEDDEFDGYFRPQKLPMLDKPRLQELFFKEIAQYDDYAKSVLEKADKEHCLYFPLTPNEFAINST